MTSKNTAAVRAGVASDRGFGAVIPPLYLSSNFTFEAPGVPRRYDYTRSGNPTRSELAAALAGLEGAAGGVVTATGMAAITTVLQLLRSTDRVVAPHDCYGGTYRLLSSLSRRGLLRVDFLDQTDESSLAAAFAEPTALVWLETPSNPLLRVVDVERWVAEAHRHGARVAVDNTFLSPAGQQPLELGADVVVHSTTKYLGGHSDVVGGAVLATSEELADELAWWANCLGVTGSPFDSYLVLRGVRTLHARMQVHERNAGEIARRLQDHPGVRAVHYPGLASNPFHERAARQQQLFGGMLSFEPNAGVELDALVRALSCFSLAESLGGVESLISHPATMTHASMDAAARRAAGISDQLLRLSVGIEDVEDLWQDLDRALRRAAAGQAAHCSRKAHSSPA